MGDVFEARDVRDGSPVAIKVQAATDSPVLLRQLEQRLQREARILQELKHENLPIFRGAGILPSGQAYLVMELLVGRPMTAFQGSSLQILLPLLLQATHALQAIAEAGVVHRDVSPDNLFVVEVGGRSVVKLIDFGIARDTGAHQEQLTRAGSFLGKPDFCSPEQTGLLPGSQRVAWQSDLYSFGLTAWFLVCGEVPFGGRTLLEQLEARLKELPKESSDCIPNARFRKLLRSLLRVRPQDRPASFEEVSAELLLVQAELMTETARVMSDTSRIKRKIAAREAPAIATSGGTARPTRPSLTPPEATAPVRRKGAPSTMSAARPIPRSAYAGGALLVIGLASVLASSIFDFSHDFPAELRLIQVVLVGAGAVTTTWAAARHRQRSSSPGPAGPEAGSPFPLARTLELSVVGDGATRRETFGDASRSLPGEVLIGRVPPAGRVALTLGARTVSALHARLSLEGSGYALEALSSTNETLLNGRALPSGERHPVRAGDRIEVGEVTIVVGNAGASDQGAPGGRPSESHRKPRR